ncbi:Septum formation protein maf, partial [Globisporangium splendens]
MLSAAASHLAARRVILASQGLKFEVIPSTFEENLPKDQFATPDLYVIENAKQKALEVAHRVSNEKTENQSPLVVIGCDTVVVFNGVILEKPKDEQDAVAMLSSLSDTTHDVYSGVALVTSTLGFDKPYLFFEKTRVTFGPLEADDIRAYIATGEPMDKAGAYGIQGHARCFVSALDGCYNNVMGFPVQRFGKELKHLAATQQL